MSLKSNYKITFVTCFVGYITQALLLTLPSLLFTVFYNDFNISLKNIGVIITITFCIQIFMDISSCAYIDKTGFRLPSIFAHICCFLGLILLSILPFVLENKFLAVSLPIYLTSVGGGLIEVLASPIAENLPTKEKSSAMSLLHSFFCWGQLFTALFSCLFFFVFGLKNWPYLPLILSLVPLINIILLLFVPMPSPVLGEKKMNAKELFSNRYFLLFLLLMLCAGAAEQAMSQWASLFAESGLKISKFQGDLLGISLFALLMGVSRLFYGLKATKIDLSKFILFSSLLAIFSYILTIFSSNSLISLLGCALTGLAVGIMWPGTFSLASKTFPGGGTLMFALLAFFGDIGCSLGPGMVGFLSDLYQKNTFSFSAFSGDLISSGLKFGLSFAILFPVAILFVILKIKKRRA